MLYDCPTCGAREGSVHRASCTLAGYPVEVRYRPFDWNGAFKWFKERSPVFKRQAPRQYLFLNAQDLTHVIGPTYKQADAAYRAKYGPAPPVGRHFIVQQL